MTDDIFFATAAELAAGLEAKRYSSLELTDAFLERLKTVGPRYNALAHLMEEPAREQARRADGLFAQGIIGSPLQGIPCGVKDLLATRQAPTEWGAPPYRGQSFDYDATVVARLSAAGAVIIGKLAMIELAGGGGYRFAAASITGPCRNPWNADHWAGGSSSGSGSAVAGGMAPYAIGSETLGSIVTPASFCGVTGLRPTYGYVSRHGAMALSWTLDKLGPLAHSAEDCGQVLAAISGPDQHDATTSARRFEMPSEPRIPLREMRVGFLESDFGLLPEPDARGLATASLEAVRGLGVKMVEVRLADVPYGTAAGMIIRAEAASIFEDMIRDDKFESLADERQKAGLRAALDTPATAYLKAMRIRTIAQQKMREVFEHVDLLVGPARLTTAGRIDEPLNEPSKRLDESAAAGNRELLAASNLTGYPAISLPCGLVNGLPFGIQFVARPFEDDLLVSAGMAFQTATSWHRERPRV